MLLGNLGVLGIPSRVFGDPLPPKNSKTALCPTPVAEWHILQAHPPQFVPQCIPTRLFPC